MGDKTAGLKMNAVARAGSTSSRSFGLAALASRLARRSPIDLWFAGIFVVASIFFVWTAATAQPLSLDGGSVDRYNLLASAFLHFHLWIGHAPAGLLELQEPYNPEANQAFTVGPTDATSINDDLLYNGHLFFIWGPAPALLLLVPLHLLGFEPSSSVTVSVFAIAGLGFALAALRVVIRKIGSIPLWMCVLGGVAVALSSTVPFMLRTPAATADTLAAGYCFMMAGIWLALSAIQRGRASLLRLAIASLCFGLATGSRPPLALSALVLVPVYLRLRKRRSLRELLPALAGPFGVCCLLLLAYNQARFGQPFNFGAHYQLAGIDSQTAPMGRLSYLSSAWPYAVTPLQFTALFPFINLLVPNVVSPNGLARSEMTGGLLLMAPIVVFLVALPWLQRRRRARLGALAVPLMILACVGVIMALASVYETFATTERYEVEFATLLALGGVAAWLALSAELSGYRRRLLAVGGALLAAWGCITGLAVSFVGYEHRLAFDHSGTWSTLENIGSPLSTAIAAVIGHPMLAEVAALSARQPAPGESATDVTMYLAVGEVARIMIVSPDSRTVKLAANIVQRHALQPAFPPVAVRIAGSGRAAATYALPPTEGNALLEVKLKPGINNLTLSPQVTGSTSAQLGGTALVVSHVSLAG